MPDTLIYQLTTKELFELFKTTNNGLTTQEAEARLTQFGPNQLTVKKKISAISIYLSQFKNTLTLILIGAALLILFIYFFGEHDQSDLIEAGLILGIVLLITLLGFFQEFKAERAIESLKKLLAYKAKVIRDKKTQEIAVSQLVPGDVVILEEGLKVPADIRLISVSSLQVNEASLTGESAPVNKTIESVSGDKQIADQINMVFSGTSIASGRGVGIVVKTGDVTEIGKIARNVAQVTEEATPIQKRLNHIGKLLGIIILAVCSIVFVFIVFFAKDFSSLPLLQRVIHSFIAAVALAVAAIPEGLPAVVTISLALGTQRMLKKNALVRKLNSVETLGSTDVICSDKTGTLTKGEMTVKKLFCRGAVYDVTGVGYETIGEFYKDATSVQRPEPILIDPRIPGNETLELLLEIGAACNNASLTRDGRVLGDPTEGALLVSATKGNVTISGERVLEIPFSSERKMMSVVIKKNDKYIVFAKGAPEILLTKCHLSQEKEMIVRVIHEFSTQALRTLGFAYKEISSQEFELYKAHPEKFEEALLFVGLQGMIDPPRKEVAPLITSCQQSGIRVIMITGDHVETAKAVAREIGIVGNALTGQDLEDMDDAQFATNVATVSIYARVNPGVKMRIVDALQKQGHIVAMTGDGVNDAPALKKADIGIAMGITGTDVAKEASDMVLLDDHFATIIAAIEEGRGIYHNIRKFVVYLLTCNIAEIIIVFFGVMIFQELVATATLLLWINIVTDGLPAIALGLDPAERNILRYSPKAFQAEIVSRRLWGEMVIISVLLAVLVLGLFGSLLSVGLASAQSAAFSAIVVFELIVIYMIRSNYQVSFFANKWLFIAVAVSLVLQLVILYVPLFANLFQVQPIGGISWMFIGLGSIWLWLAYKLVHLLAEKSQMR